MLVEVNVTGTHDTFGRGIPESVARVPYVAKEEAATGDEVVLVAGVLRYVRIGKTSEGAKIADVWFTTIERLKGGATRERRGWEHVLDMG
jgi:hypothetical protein